MNRLDIVARTLVVATLLIAMSVFTSATPLTLIALVLGGAMIVLSSIYSYRPGAVMGVVIVAMGAAASIRIDSLLEVSTLLTAILGLLLPLLLLALYAFEANEEDVRVMSIRGRPALLALAFCLVCVLAAPLVVGLMSLVLPTMTMRLSGTAETAMVLLVAAAVSILLTRRTSARKTIDLAKEAPGEKTA